MDKKENPSLNGCFMFLFAALMVVAVLVQVFGWY